MGIFKRKMKRQAKDAGKIISALAAATIFTLPALGHAQNITKADGANAGTIISNGNVHEIFADEYAKNDTAINHFSNFQLDAQNIANMHFGQQGGADAGTLVNLVDSRADINGIVNAVRDGSIGGNLYFISSKGIAVGSEGVINAGKIGLISPTDSYYQNLVANKGDLSAENFSADKIRNGEIPLNVTGTISVAGKLNATDGINLAAANIDLQNTAQLQSVRTINYADYVNVSEEVSAGLDASKLTVTKNDAGEIVIAAAIDSKNFGLENNILDSLGLNLVRLSSPNSATVNIEDGAKIKSDGNVDIRALAKSDIDIELGETTAVGTFLSMQSNVKVDGEVTGDNVNISAQTTDNYKFNSAITGNEENAIDLGIDADSSMTQTLVGIYNGAKNFLNVPTLLRKLHISAAFVGHNNSAEVKIGDKAVITATGADSANPALNISSAGTFNSELKASNIINGSLPALGFTFSYSGNASGVEVGGKLDAQKGSLAVTSNADTNFSVNSTIDATQRTGSAVTLVTNFLGNDQGSNVNIDSNANLNAAKNISVKSISNSPTNVIAEVQNDSGGLGALSVNYVSQTDDAKINTDAKINAGGNVEINASKSAPTYKILSNIATERPDLLSQVQAYTGNIVKNIVDGATQRANEKNSNDNSSASENTGSYITTNANIGIETSNAKIKVGKNSAINAGGSVNVSSKVNFGDPEVGALNVSSSDFVGQKDSVSLSPAVNFIKSTNDSGVIFEGDTNIKGTDVAIKSEFESNNARFAKARKDIVDSAEEIKNIFSSENLAEKSEVATNFLQSLTALKAADIAAFVTQGADMSEILNDLRTKLDEKTKFLDEYQQKINTAANNAQAEQILQEVGAKYPNVNLNEMKDSLFKGAEDLLKGGDASKVTAKIDNLKNSFSAEIATIEKAIKSVDTICDTSKVANYYSDKEQVSGKNSNSQQTGLALAGTVNVAILNNSTQLLVGKNTTLDAQNNVDIATDLKNIDMAVSGHIKPQTAAASALNLIVNTYIANDDNILAVGENTAVNGKNISVAGKNYVNHVLFADGSGVAPDSRSRASGTVNYGGGESLALVSVDDEVKFKTDGAVNVKAENDSNLLNIAGGLAYASGAANAGASIAINSFNVQTLGAISNNDVGETSELVAKILDKVEDKNIFGTNEVTVDGKISAQSLKVNAHSDGAVNSLSIAGSLSTNGDSNNGSSSDAAEDTAIDPEKASDLGVRIPDFNAVISYVQKYFALDDNAANSDNAADENASVLTKSVRKIDATQKSDKGSTTSTSSNEDAPVKNEKPSDVNTPKTNELVDSKSMPSFTISGAGSASVNMATNRTVAGIEVKNVEVKSSVESQALDETFTGAWSGAGALNFRNYKSSQSAKDSKNSSTNVGMAGAVGLNIIDAAVTSQIKNTSVVQNTSELDAKIKELNARQEQLKQLLFEIHELGVSYDTVEDPSSIPVYIPGRKRDVDPAKFDDYLKEYENNSTELSRLSSLVSNATIKNNASKTGAIIAAAPSLAIQHNSGENANNYSGAASVSINIVENKVDAEILNSNVAAKSLTNTAENDDTQITGGINIATATGGNKGVALGGSVAVAHIQNSVNANIDGGTFNLTDSLKNNSTGSITQIVGAVGVSVATGSSSSYGFQGVLGYNRADNKNYATISNANITAKDITNVSADNKDAAKKFDSFLNSTGLDAKGQSYADEAEITNADSSQNAGKKQTSNEGTVADFDENKSKEKTKTTNYGNKVITGAFALAGAGNGAAMASIAISDVDNDFVSTINGGTIKLNSTDAIKIKSESNTLDINAAAGAAISSKGFGAGGSVSWQTTDNNVIAGIGSTGDNSNKTTLENVSGVDVDAETGALEVNVAGQISGGKGVAAGLAMAYNALNDTTDAFVKNVDSSSDKTAIEINSASNGSVYAVGANVGVSANSAAIGGSIAINRGANSTLAEIENSNISNAGNISVDAGDKVNKLAVVGNLQVSGGKAAVGGAVAYNDIGTSTSDKQKTSASILNSKITNGKNTSVKVNAQDESELTTIGVGVGVAAGGAAVQGAVAVSTINKDVSANVEGTTLDISNTPEIHAQSSESIINSADVLSVQGGTGAAIGAGVAINNDKTNTTATLNQSTVNSNGLDMYAKNNSKILNIGIGGSGGGTGAAITGSVAVNNIGTQTISTLDGTNINSTGDENVVVDSQSDELISNYAGSVSFTATGAAVGISVSVNNINSETSSNVKDGSITVNRVDNAFKNVSLKNTVPGDSVADKSFIEIFTGSDEKVGSGKLDEKGNKKEDSGESETSKKVGGIFKANQGLEQQRASTDYRGVVINSSATHTLQSLMINAGGTGTGAAVNGTVDINLVDGSTGAKVDGTKLNTTNAADDINILANDYTKTRGVVGTANVALTGAAVGLGNDSHDIARKVEASYSGKRSGADLDVSTNNFNIAAKNIQGLNSIIAGLSAAIEGAGVSNSTGVYLMEGETNANLEKANVLTHNLDVDAYHNAEIKTLGIAAGFAGLGAGVGLGVDVLRETDKTATSVDNVDVTFKNTDGTAKINALNHTGLDYSVYDVGGALVGTAAAVGVSNVLNNVSANVKNSNFNDKTAKADTIQISGTNTLDFDERAFAGAAGVGGIGAGVSVTTIDGKVNTTIENSTLTAKTLNIDSSEERSVDQTAGSLSVGGVGISTNVMVTSVGDELKSSYRSETNENGKEEDGTNVNIDEKISKANDGTSENNSVIDGISKDENANPMRSLGIKAPSVTATKGGGEINSGVGTNISGSTLTAENITINNEADNNIDITGFTASAGGWAVGGGVGILNVNRNAVMNIANSNIEATNNLQITNLDAGTSALKTYQGSLGVFALNASYSALKSSGVDNLQISGGSLKAGKDLTIDNHDRSQTGIKAVGVTGGLAGGGVLIAEGDVTNNNKVSINGTTLTSEGGSVNVTSNSGDGNGSLDIETVSVTGSVAFAGAGVGVIAKGNSTAEIDIGQNTKFNAAKDIYVSAQNDLSVKTKTSADTASMLAALSATVLENNIGTSGNPLTSKVKIGDGSEFNADSVNIESVVKPGQALDMKALDVGAVSIGVHAAGLKTFTDNTVDIGNIKFKDGAEVKITNSTAPTQTANVAGLNIGVIASGTQAVSGSGNFNASTKLGGTSSNADIAVNAAINSAPTVTVNGDGGGVVDLSPYAAKIDNSATMNSVVDVSGKWTPKTLSITNENTDGGTLTAEATRAAVAGASAVLLNRNATSNATINFAGGTEITTAGRQNYSAKNTMAVNEKIDASGYGGLNANAAAMGGNLNYNSAINVGDGNTSAKFKATEDKSGIFFESTTGGELHYKNTLNSTGVAALTVAYLMNNSAINNSINVKKSDVTTQGLDSDITFAASEDNALFDFIDISNLNAGLGGVVSSTAYSNLTRNHNINFADTNIDSSRDINIYADANANHEESYLTMSLLSDAYNRTVIPLSTSPSLTNKMTQTNTVNIDGGSNLLSNRNINLQSAAGQENIVESSREFNIYTGTKGKSTMISTANGDNAGLRESQDNTLTIDGTLRAGKHNELDILIENDTGSAGENSKVVTVNVDGASPIKVRVTVNKGNEVVDVNKIQAGSNIELANPFIDEYNQTKKALDDYPKDSQQYKDLQAYLNGIADSMVTYGFAEKTSSGYNIHEKITQTVVDIPDFALSGGDIKISAGKLGGTGSLTARTAIGTTIKNTSSLPLRINNVNMENAGGYVSFNGDILTKDGYNFKTLDMDGNFDKPPILEVTHSGKKYASLKPDIYVDGNINDSTGKVTLTDENGSVIVRGNILASGGVDIVTPNGGFMLNNTKETFNLADPMAKYTFGNEDVSNALQKYIALNNGTFGKTGHAVESSDTLTSLVSRIVRSVTPSVAGDAAEGGNHTTFVSYDDYLNFIFDQISNATRTETGGSTDKETWKTNIQNRYGEKSSSDEPGASIVTNGPINITAKYINVNGLIQSGFTNYTGKVDSSKVDLISSKVDLINSGISTSISAQKLTELCSNFRAMLNDISNVVAEDTYNVVTEDYQNLYKQVQEAKTDIELAKLLSSKIDIRYILSKLDTAIWGADMDESSVEMQRWQRCLDSFIKLKTVSDKIVSATTVKSTLKDSEVAGNEKYLVTSNTGNKVWNSSTKMYDGVVNVYYNPATKNLLTDDININGGYVRLKGTVVSTGNGRILSAKGGADITIDTTSADNDIYLGTINNNDRQGVVVINDSSKSSSPQIFTSNSTYTPDNYAFGWTGGVDYRVTTEHEVTVSGNVWSILGNAAWGFFTDGIDGAKEAIARVLDLKMRTDDKTKGTIGDPTSLKDLTQGAFLQKINDSGTWDNIKNNTLYTSTSSSGPNKTRKYNYSKDKASLKWGPKWYNKITSASIEMKRTWYQDDEYSATSTYYIPANKQISIETPTATNGGKITVNANGNVYVDKNINNPTSGSSIDIKSTNGVIETKNNSVLQGDNITLNAKTGITADITGTNGTINLNAESATGDIKITTSGSLNVNDIKTSDKSVIITADGDIKSINGKNISAPTITLTSEHGSISGDVINSDKIKLNAAAQGDITLTAKNGDLVIEKVESKGGNVSLTTPGNILDGTGQTYELSNSTDRLQRWIDAGLISSDDSDDSAEKAAAAQKAVVLESITQRAKVLAANSEERLKLYTNLAAKLAASQKMQNARTFYAYGIRNSKELNQAATHNLDDAAKDYNDILNSTSTYKKDNDTYRADYLNRLKDFFSDTDLTADEMEIVSEYAWANSSDAYGFSKNQLLYAIQEGILNSTPGQTVTVNSPNIIGNNITLSAQNGGIGNDDATEQTIKAEDLGKLDNLKTLSTLKAGDLTWNSNGDAIIKRQHPVSLEIKNNDGANLSVSAKNQIYLVGTENSKFNFSKFDHDTNSNVRLMTGNGIFTNGDTKIDAKDLIAYGGYGTVGTKDNPLKVNLAGSLEANSGDSVYVSSVGDNKLTIQAIAANNDVSLHSQKDMVMTTEDGKTEGYILGKNISLNVDTGIDESILTQIQQLQNETKKLTLLITAAEYSNNTGSFTKHLNEVLEANIEKLNDLYAKVTLNGYIGAANDGLRIYSSAPQISSAPHVSINAAGAIINNVGTGFLYFDKIFAPSGFGLKNTEKAGYTYTDDYYKNNSEEILNVYKNGFYAPKFHAFNYTLDDAKEFFKKMGEAFNKMLS